MNFPKALLDILSDHIGLSQEEASEYFVLNETENDWVLKLRQGSYLETTTYHAMLKLVQEKGGAYHKQPRPAWYIPKIKPIPVKFEKEDNRFIPLKIQDELERRKRVDSQATYKEVATRPAKVEPSLPKKDFEIDKETVEKLRKSKEIIGYLGDVVKDQQGNILSGRHRKLADPNWPEKQVNVTDPLQRELLILHYNVQRPIKREETQRRLLRIAKIIESTGVPKNQVCREVSKLVPFTDQYVRTLLPDEYKMVQMARQPKIAKVVSQIEESQDTRHEGEIQRDEWGRPQIFTCALCGHPILTPVPHGDKLVCRECDKKLQENPELLERLGEPERPKPKKVEEEEPVKKTESRIYKPKETWTFRKARMSPLISKFEDRVMVKLQKKGFPLGKAQGQITLPFPIPDRNWQLPRGCMVLFLDGPPHKGREAKDEAIREALRTLGVNVVEIKYERDSDEAAEEAVETIASNLKEMGWTKA